MRKFLVISILLVSLLVTLGTTAGVALAEAGPFSPGDVLFPMQHYVEQQAFFRPTADQRAIWFLDLMERRMTDVEAQAGTSQQAVAVQYFSDSVNQVARFTARTTSSGFQVLQPRLLLLLEQSEQVVANLTPVSVEGQSALFAVYAKVRTFQTLIADSKFSDEDFNQIISLNPAGLQNQSQANSLSGADNQALDPMTVPFPAGSPGDEHAFFPLEGAHAVTDCEACHASGDYQGTAATCEACHADVTPPDHYLGDCAGCHIPTNWQDAIFDHTVAGATDCASCHSAEAPANHYPG
ncbi:MAG: cytochrome c3 family protein, partial [Anaerolineae bacterium]|nr:cytochrome c3 family protein [Anaerolineae bacterium]